jgi:hypothetical protein
MPTGQHVGISAACAPGGDVSVNGFSPWCVLPSLHELGELDDDGDVVGVELSS